MYTVFYYKDGNKGNPQRFTPLAFETFLEGVEELKRFKEIDEKDDVTGNFSDEVDEKNGTYSHDTQNYFVKRMK